MKTKEEILVDNGVYPINDEFNCALFKALIREIRSLSKEKPDLMVDAFINDMKIEHLESKVDKYLQE
jgi:hypothetical protein